MVSLRRLNRQTKDSVERALVHEVPLAALYSAQFRRAASHASSQFRQRAHVSLSAAANPEPPAWVPPDIDELTTEPLDAKARAKARRIHLQALVAAAPQAVKDAAADLGISFDVDSPFVAPLLDKTAARTVNLTKETRDVMRKIIGQAYSEGWSVPQTADALQQSVEGLGETTAVMQARTDLVGLGNGASVMSAVALGDAAPPTKIWLTAGDELVRSTHADAEGQEVPIDQPFQVGDDELAYPGDPDGSDAEVINCRCTVVYGDGTGANDSLEASAGPAGSSVQPADGLRSAAMGTETESPEALAAAVTITVDEADGDVMETAAGSVRWRAILCVEGEPSQDGPSLIRMLKPGGGSWRDLPLPLGVMFETPHAMDVPAPVCGRIDLIYRGVENPNEIWGEGVFNPDEVGCKAAEYVENLSLRGVSIDPYVRGMEITEPDSATENDMASATTEIEPTVMLFTDYVIGGATICPFQALENATIAIVASGEKPTGALVAVDGRIEIVHDEALVAAGVKIAELPPREWFETQEPPGPMPLTVTDDGRVFGHLALWDSCHTGLEGTCIRPPKSHSKYAYFHVGELEIAGGDRLAVGKLMIAKRGRSGKHASIEASRLEAARHYDDNAAVGAYVRVVDGRYGPWAAGCVRPGLDADGLAELKANPPSGDWRRVNGSLDLIAALSVPVPGFPVPRADIALVAAGGLLELSALIASSGPIEPSEFVQRALERAEVLPRDERRLARPQAAA